MGWVAPYLPVTGPVYVPGGRFAQAHVSAMERLWQRTQELGKECSQAAGQAVDDTVEGTVQVIDATTRKVVAIKDAATERVIQLRDAATGKLIEIGEATHAKYVKVRDAVTGKITQIKDAVTGKVIEVRDAATGKLIDLAFSTVKTAKKAHDARKLADGMNKRLGDKRTLLKKLSTGAAQSSAQNTIGPTVRCPTRQRYLVFVSDTHMAMGGKLDGFRGHDDGLVAFLENVQSLEDCVLFLNGDIVDLWQTITTVGVPPIADAVHGGDRSQVTLSEVASFYTDPTWRRWAIEAASNGIMNAHPKVFDAISALKSVSKVKVLTGNHDDCAAVFWRKLGMPSFRSLRTTCSSSGDEMIIEHGHRFDPFNRPGTLKLGGMYGTSFKELTDGKVGEVFDKFMHSSGTGDKTVRDYRKKAIDHLEDVGAAWIVLGHTHKKDLVRKGKKAYANSGNWSRGKQDYLVFDRKTGKLTAMPS